MVGGAPPIQVHARHVPPNSHDGSSGPEHSASGGHPPESPSVVESAIDVCGGPFVAVSDPSSFPGSVEVEFGLVGDVVPESERVVEPCPSSSVGVSVSGAVSVSSGESEAGHPNSIATKQIAPGLHQGRGSNVLDCIAAPDGRRARLLTPTSLFHFFSVGLQNVSGLPSGLASMSTAQPQPTSLQRRTRSTLLVVALVFPAMACDSKSAASADKGQAPSGSPAPSSLDKPAPQPEPAQAQAKPAPAQAQAKVELTEYALDAAGAEWAGWVATAPTGCKLMEDMPKRARVACDGREGLDVTFDQNEVDFAEEKKTQEKADAMMDDTKISFTKDEADMLEWSRENTEHGFTSSSFLHRKTVEGVVITCGNSSGAVMGEELLQQHKDACASIKKK